MPMKRSTTTASSRRWAPPPRRAPTRSCSRPSPVSSSSWHPTSGPRSSRSLWSGEPRGAARHPGHPGARHEAGRARRRAGRRPGCRGHQRAAAAPRESPAPRCAATSPNCSGRPTASLSWCSTPRPRRGRRSTWAHRRAVCRVPAPVGGQGGLQPGRPGGGGAAGVVRPDRATCGGRRRLRRSPPGGLRPARRDGGAARRSFTELYVELWRLLTEPATFPLGEALHARMLPYLSRWMQSVELVVAVEKEISRRRGWFASAAVRSQGADLDRLERERIERFLVEFDGRTVRHRVTRRRRIPHFPGKDRGLDPDYGVESPILTAGSGPRCPSRSARLRCGR